MNTASSSAAAQIVGFWMVCASTLQPVHASDTAGTRVRNGLLALYDFASPSGEIVADRSGVGKPLDLEIADPLAVRRREGSLEVRCETLVRSPGRAAKIAEAVRLSGEITIEAWFQASMGNQRGPARIVTMSPRGYQRNFTLGQDGDRFDIRFRTTRTGTNGLPSLSVRPKNSTTDLTHLVYTRDRTGRTRVFVNGERILEQIVKGSTEGWEGFPFALASELGGDSPWLGTFYLVAIYSRDLLAREVEQNFRAGADYRAEVLLSEESSSGADLFSTEIAPLFSSKCLECHDSSTKSGGLDLSHKETAFAGGANGEILTPGDAAGSRLIELTEKGAMPLGRPPLLKAEKALLRKWVDDGAAWTIDKIDPAVHAEPEHVSETWVQRLTVPEYVETIRGALGIDISSEAAEILPEDKRAEGFKNTAYNLNVDLGHVGAYARLAQMVVSRMDVTEFAGKYSNNQSLGDAELTALISKIGSQLLRGPLEEEELSMYKGLSSAVVSAGGDFEEVVSYVVEAILQSPRFLYRVENQRGDGTAWPVGEYELASRLSYILWGAPPDSELRAAADAGELHNSASFERHIRRMLDDPRAIERSSQFIDEWLDLDRLNNLQPNKEMFPEWDPRIAADMRTETLAFFQDIVWKQQRPLTDLLNAQFTYATPRLAAHYGLEPKGDGLERYDLSLTSGRGGLLTHGSVLTIGGDEGSMVTRGLFVLDELLLGEVGSPPPGLDTTPPPTSPGRSNRAISMGRVESPACGGCHSKFEPLAFGLERFDGLGAYREADEHGNELRQDGEILFPGEAEPVSYKSAAAMMDLLASSDRVQQALTRKLTQFTLGRPLVVDDEPLIAKIHEMAREGGGTYASLITAIVKSDLVQTTRTEF